MTDRISCCVPFCRRTCRNDKGYTDFLCQKHWPTVSRHLRRRHSKLDWLYRRRFGENPYWHYKGGSPDRLTSLKLGELCRKAWDRCKIQAIERAAGI